MIPHAVQPIAQLKNTDCAVAALAMLLGVSYRQVADRIRKDMPRAQSQGMWTTEICRVAFSFGTKLKRRSKTSDAVEGLTGLILTDNHAAVMFQGVVIDPSDGQVWDRETWLLTKNHKLHSYWEAQ